MADEFERLSTALAQRYRIEREIGRGGMATVYLAEDLKHHRQVAIKVLNPELAAGLGPERFLREIEIAARLTHPHILPLHDSGESEGFLYYVMPFLAGESLRDRLKREKQLSLEESVEISKAVADALSYAHSQGIVHRDIKPENILFAAGHAVVTDFGIARAITAAGAEHLTATGGGSSKGPRPRGGSGVAPSHLWPLASSSSSLSERGGPCRDSGVNPVSSSRSPSCRCRIWGGTPSRTTSSKGCKRR